MILVMLPAYNEEQALPPLLDAIRLVRESSLPDMKVFIVDDGSADSTAQVVQTYSERHRWVQLLRHERNMGLSQAIQTGFKTALQAAQPDDIIVTFDADNTQPPDHMVQMKALIDNGRDVVIASRFQPGAEVHGVPPMRRLYSRVMSILFQIVLPIKGVRDYSCGYRAYRAGALQAAYDRWGENFITEEGFACMVEILLQLNKIETLQFGEVPLILRYDLKPTETRMKIVKTIRETLRLAVKHRFSKSS
jgi:dolichol-phosphate mannosyltransferase